MTSPLFAVRFLMLLPVVWPAHAVFAEEVDALAHPAGGVIEMTVGDVLVVNLVGNASTGYAWQRIDDGRGVLVQVRAASRVGNPGDDADKPRLVGGSTAQTWRFRAAQAGDSELRLVYRQPWRKDVAPAREMVRRVRVH